MERFFYVLFKNDYKSMRLIDDETYAAIIKLLLKDEKVALFQKLLLCKKEESEDVENGLSESNA